MKYKKNIEKLEETEASWTTNAPDSTFYGTTLAGYKSQVQLSRDAHELVMNLEQQMLAARNNMHDIDKNNLSLEKNIARGIAGDPNFGIDSALYEGTGRVRRSERKTGLIRGRKKINEIK